MAKEYKFMFDTRFDEPEAEDFEPAEDLSAKSVDGIPSISQLLDTLNDQMQETSAPETAAKDNDVPEEPVKNDSVAAKDTVDEPPATETVAAEEPAKTSPAPASVTDNDPTAAVQAFNETLKQKAEPLFSQEEMEAAKEQAHEVGYLDGMAKGQENAWKEAMASIEKQHADALEAMNASVKALTEQAQVEADEAFSAAIELAMAVCRKVLPSLNEKHAVDEIRALLEKNFRFLKDEPKITLRVNPVLAESIKPVLADLIKKESYNGKIVVLRDESLAVGDCRAEWKNGGLERNAQDVLKQTEELLKLYAQATPESGETAA